MIDWKSAARTFFRRAEARQAHLSSALDQLAPLLDEARDESFDSWQDAARHWYEATKRERASLARERLKNAELLQKIEELRAAIPRVIDCDGMTFEQVRELLRKREAAQPSSNPGEFAALATRIAIADAKHPRDLPDGRHTHENVALIQLQLARETLAALPTWRNAITCEFNEAMYELARGDMDRFADELLDLETVSFRARRAVLERGKK